jgi:uncharacterized protein YyaL (SSP411 family)
MNRLARESSPYLLLHAENPVDWYPWGEEAFQRARREDKPIFLSVGYSTCYWCHVMERECFSDEAVAAQLNEGFVSVKLDREERPDLDEIYMTATQLLTRSGGWPNSLFLTQDLKPFYAGTYFPPDDRFGRPGFPRVLRAIRDAWGQRRAGVLEQAEAVADAIREQVAGVAPHPPGPDAAAALLASLSRRFDPEWGGFGAAPKFPSPSNLEFLLDLAKEGDEPARSMLVATLDRMARGGIQDQLGGGFHRYSTDAEWLVPHFEKMLYDNAGLAGLYAEADRLAPEAGFARVARRTLEFVLRELTSPEGAFLSAIDAETDGHEGAYYTWTRADLEAALSGEDLRLVALVHGLEGTPTFESDRYVPYLPAPLAERALALGLREAELLARLEPIQARLLEVRGRRKRPLVDDKVLTDWNGLMIGAMARCGRVLEEARYLQAAARAADFVLNRLQGAGAAALLHVFRGGAARIAAFLDDYAFLVHGLLELHDATGEARWLREAVRLQELQDRDLADGAAGGYFNAAADPDLLVRSKAAHDGATASGNGVAAWNLIRLGALTGSAACVAKARTAVDAFGPGIDQYPLAHVSLIRALRLLEGESPSEGAAARATAGPLMATARSVVRASGRVQGEGPWRGFVLELDVREGWHVNANPASLPFLVPTAVLPASGALRSLRYPEAERLSASPADDPVAVYRGHVRIEGELEVREGHAPGVRLTYQACDELRCLPPVTRDVPLEPGD